MASSLRQQEVQPVHSDHDKYHEKYKYTALKETEIRLLKLLRGSKDDPLQANLKVFPLSGAEARSNEPPKACDGGNQTVPTYEALSYHWGKKAPPEKEREHSITIIEKYDTFRIAIRPNLEQALKHLRYPYTHRWLWVDALCLWQDQKPEEAPSGATEKRVQIPRMHLIYNKAKCVCIWLGAGDEFSKDAIKFVKDISDLDTFDFDDHFKDYSKLRVQKLDSFAHLLRRDWFSRRWIVQELAVARSAMLYCGSDKVDWRDFADAVALFSSKHVNLKQFFRTSEEHDFQPQYLGDVKQMGAYRLVQIANNFFRKSDEGEILDNLVSLEEVVSMLTTFDSQDPKDIIYAVLSLSNNATASAKEKTAFTNDNEKIDKFLETRMDEMQKEQPNGRRPGLLRSPSLLRRSPSAWKLPATFDKALNLIKGKHRPDKIITIKYESSDFEVYKDFMEHTVTQSGSLDILCRPWAATMDASGNPVVLPSWMSKKSGAIFGLHFNRAYIRLRADLLVGDAGPGGKHYNASQETTARWDYRDNVLLTRSLTVHGFVLNEIGKRLGVSRGGVIPPEWYDEWQAIRMSDKTVPSSSFWRTLVADRGPEGQMKPPSYYELACKYAFKNRLEQEDLNTRDMIAEPKCPPYVEEYLERVQAVTWTRRLVVLGTKGDDQRLGLVPRQTQRGDLVCILQGCSVPVVLRRHDSLEYAKEQLKLAKTAQQGVRDLIKRKRADSEKALPIIKIDDPAESNVSRETIHQLRRFGGESHGNPVVPGDPLFAAERTLDETEQELQVRCTGLEAALKELESRFPPKFLSRGTSTSDLSDYAPNPSSPSSPKELTYNTDGSKENHVLTPGSTPPSQPIRGVDTHASSATASTMTGTDETLVSGHRPAPGAQEAETAQGHGSPAPWTNPLKNRDGVTGTRSSVLRVATTVVFADTPDTAHAANQPQPPPQASSEPHSNGNTHLQLPGAESTSGPASTAAGNPDTGEDIKMLSKEDRAGSQAWRKQPLPRYYYEFIGECYVHGLMDGEAMKKQTARPESEIKATRDLANLEEFDPPHRRTQVFWLR
jgi:Heterokaryon incompatibility protein (HET)